MCHLIFGIAVVLKILISNRGQIQNLSEEHKLQKLKLKGNSGTSYTEGHKEHFGLSTIYDICPRDYTVQTPFVKSSKFGQFQDKQS